MATHSTPQPTAKQRHWLEHLQRCEQLGLSLAHYAEQYHVDKKALYRWRFHLAQRHLLPTPPSSTAAFAKVAAVAVADTPSVSGNTQPITLTLSSARGTAIHLSGELPHLTLLLREVLS